ncbi:hypothetical protein [Parvularcula mediterranea]|nr:hypothetical protein [Parvularcula mediterranea]
MRLGLTHSPGARYPLGAPVAPPPPPPAEPQPFDGGEAGFWLDPSDFSSMTIARDGTGPAPAIGDVVGRMLDRSGNGLDAVAPSDAARPRLELVGGKPALAFDGVDDVLVINGATFGAAFSVVAGLDPIAHGTVIGNRDGINPDLSDMLSIGTKLATKYPLADGSYHRTAVLRIAGPQISIVKFGGGFCDATVEGGQQKVEALAATPAVRSTPAYLGAVDGVGSAAMQMNLFGLLLYTDQVIDAAEETLARDWVAEKMGVS